MKQTKSILMAAVAALSITAASAQPIREGTVIRVAGSTAMRSISMPALNTWATAPAQGYTRVAADNTNPASQHIALYIRDRGNVRDAINVRLVGSEGGLLTTAGTRPANRQSFLPVVGTNWSTNSPLVTVTSANCTVPGFAAVTFADQSQALSAYNASSAARVRVASLGVGTPLAALNFAFFAPTNFPASNITSQTAKALLERGNVPLSMFTGNAADSNKGVWLTGRDFDSGTRAVTLLETGYGVNKAVKQYVVNGNSVELSPATTLLGTPVAAGNGGYASGGTLRSAVTNNSLTFPANSYSGGNFLIGYAGVPDVVAARAKALSFNGVQPYCPPADVGTAQGFSTTVNGLENGSYSYWSIAYLYSNSKNVANTPAARNQLNSLVTVVANAIKEAPSSQLKNGNTKLTPDMKVNRANGVAATIFPN